MAGSLGMWESPFGFDTGFFFFFFFITLKLRIEGYTSL